MLGGTEVALGIHRSQDRVVGHPLVERGHEGHEERGAAEELVRGRGPVGGRGVGHATILVDGVAVLSARSTMCRIIGGKTNAWNGATDHQYACPASPRG